MCGQGRGNYADRVWRRNCSQKFLMEGLTSKLTRVGGIWREVASIAVVRDAGVLNIKFCH